MKKRVIEQTQLQQYRVKQPFTTMPSVDEWLCYWLETYIQPTCKPNTYANFYSYIHAHLLPMLGDYLLDEIGTVELQYYIDNKLSKGRRDGNGGLSSKTVKEHISLFNNAIKKAIAIQLLVHNPAACIDLPKQEVIEVRVFDREEQQLLENAIDPTYQPNSAITILLGLYGGLRIGEVSALRLNDIDFIKRQICVDESLNRIAQYDKNSIVKYKLIYGTTKSNKVRYVPMHDDVYNALIIYFNTMPCQYKKDQKAPLFMNRRGNVMEPRMITHHFQNILKHHGIIGYHFHCLRHTFATRALEAQMDIKSCSKILGHATTQITLDRYTHVSADHLQKEIRKLNHIVSAS